jgi:hypothetical protein
MAAPLPNNTPTTVYGPFHRLEGTGGTQGPATARSQCISGEVWGLPSRYSGDVPLAQAHRGPLPHDAVGIEFVSFAPPDKQWGAPEWRLPHVSDDGRHLVSVTSDPTLGPLVKVKVAITRVSQAI